MPKLPYKKPVGLQKKYHKWARDNYTKEQLSFLRWPLDHIIDSSIDNALCIHEDIHNLSEKDWNDSLAELIELDIAGAIDGG